MKMTIPNAIIETLTIEKGGVTMAALCRATDTTAACIRTTISRMRTKNKINIYYLNGHYHLGLSSADGA